MNRFARILMNGRLHAMSRIRLVDSMLKDFNLPLEGNALELGCGAGFVSAHLASNYRLRVVGTDAETDRIETSRRKNADIDNLSFLIADATSLPFDDGSFDLLLAQNVFHHIPDWRAAAEEVARVTRPGGIFMFSDILGTGALIRLFSRLERDHGFHDTNDLISLLGSRGFEAIERVEPRGRVHKEFMILFVKSQTAGVML
jgi:ubiquinone/menaquinone biosynthesis C-methylase UbiE